MSDEKMKDIEGDIQMQDALRDSDDRGQGRKGKVFFRKKVCRFCTQKSKIDYKDSYGLRRYTTERGNIPVTCAKHQRQLTEAIKRARHIALLPYVND